MTENKKAFDSQNNRRRTSQSVKTVLAHVAVAFLVLLSGPSWAEEQPGGPSKLASEATVSNPASPPKPFSNVPPPNEGGAVSQAPKVPIGKGEGGFSAPPPKVSADAKSDMTQQDTGNSEGGAGPLKLKVRKGDLEIDLTIPGEKHKKQPIKQSQKKSGKKKNLAAEDCQKAENKQKCHREELLGKEQERALNQRHAGKKAVEGLKRVQEQVQSGLETTVGNIGRMNEMLDKFGAGPKASDVDVSDMDLGESDTLGELN